MATSASFDFVHCPEMLFIAASDGVLLRQTEMLARMLGPAVGQGTSLANAVHPEDKKAFSEAWARLQETPEQGHFTCRIRDAKGAYRTLGCRAHWSPDTKAMYGSLREVPSHEDARTARQRIMALQAFVDNLPVAFWVVDRKGMFTYNGGNGAVTAGLSEGALVGLKFIEVYGDAPGDAIPNLRAALAGEARHWTGEAYDRFWENWALPFRDDAGEVDAVVGIAMDITETRRKEQELRERMEMSERQQKVIRDLSTPIIEVWDGVLTLPMVGIVDSTRTAELMSNLLDEVSRKGAHYAVLDLTGVEMVDTKTAQYLLEIVRAIRLLGAEGIITGIRPNVAQTMVALGLDLSSIPTLADLRAGLKLCMQKSMKADAVSAAQKNKSREPAASLPPARPPVRHR